jgi:hypothetical protein
MGSNLLPLRDPSLRASAQDDRESVNSKGGKNGGSAAILSPHTHQKSRLSS